MASRKKNSYGLQVLQTEMKHLFENIEIIIVINLFSIARFNNYININKIFKYQLKVKTGWNRGNLIKIRKSTFILTIIQFY